MQPDARLHLVLEPEDAPDRLAAVRALANLPAGRVVAVVTPGARSIDWLAHDVLGGLGKEEQRAGASIAGRENWRRTAAWLAGERAAHLIVAKADLLNRGGWTELALLAAATNLTLWLVSHGPGLTRGQREFAQEWPIQQIAFEELLGRWSDTSDAPRAAGVRDDAETETATLAQFPEVPENDFTYFRAECWWRLARDDFATVDSALRDAALHLDAALAQERTVTGTVVKQHLRDVISGARSFYELLTRLRGAQITAMRYRWSIRVDVARLATTAITAKAPLDEAFVQRLRPYTSTRHALCACLMASSDISPEAVSRLNVGDLDENELRVGDRRVDIPDAARPIVRAHLYARAAAGAHADDPLVSDAIRGELGDRCTPRGIRLTINAVAKESGLGLWDEHNTLAQPTEEHWLRRRGITLQAL